MAHNRGMEKKMIDSYKEGRKGDLKFLKNRVRTAKMAYQQAMKRTHPWHGVHHRIHSQMGGHVPNVSNVVDPQAPSLQLWPPFSVANAAVPIQVKPSTSIAGGNQQNTTMSSGYHHSSTGPGGPQRSQPEQQPNQLSTQPMYPNLIPALFFPAQMAGAPKPTGGYLAVSMPTSFIQQPLQLLQPLSGSSMMYQPTESHIGSNFIASSQIRAAGGSLPTESRVGVLGQSNIGLGNHGNVRSPDRQNSMSGDSSTIEEATRGRVHVKNIIPNDLGPGKKAFTFQRPSSRTGSRATSIKAEPGSALESNLESNASVSASVRAEKQEASPSSRFMASVGLQEQVLLSTDSSMCSLLKSSDDFSSTTPNDGSEDDEKEFAPHRPSLPDPSWLTNVDMSPQIIMNYQMKSKPLTEVLKRDQNALQLMTQPNQVREQLAQLYRELEVITYFKFHIQVVSGILQHMIIFIGHRRDNPTFIRGGCNYFMQYN